MRRSGWLLPVPGSLLWLAAVAYPAVALVSEAARATRPGPGPGSVVPIRPPAVLLAETAGAALVITVAAVLLGWIPGRVLGRRLARGGSVPLAALFLLPICLPAYVVFYAWWQAWPADGAIFAWAVERGLVPLLRRATLVAGLTCWSWPIVAWCVAGAAARGSVRRDEMLRLDRAGVWRRLAVHVRTDGPGLRLGGLVVFLVAFNNTTCFDLAQIFTVGNELRARDALGASAGQLVVSALPALALVAVAAVVMWPAGGNRGDPGPHPPGRSHPAAWVWVALLWIVSLVVPLGLFAVNAVGGGQVGQFIALYGRDLADSVLLATASATLGMCVGVGLAVTWLDRRRWVRALAHGQGIGWLVAALVPGTLVGVALEAAYNRPFELPLTGGLSLADAVYRRPSILVLGHLARFAIVGALLGRWMAFAEPRALADLRRVDGADTALGALRAAGPALAATAIASFAVILVLAVGEIPVTARVHPPGSNPLAVTILNDMHYQRPQAVMVAVLVLFALALGATAVASAVWIGAARIVRGGTAAAAVLAATLILPACDAGGADDEQPLPTRLVFGTTGTALGQFAYPRCIALDADAGVLYVIDKTARVQRFDLDGRPQLQWRMPAKENGKPTGISVAPDGRVFVADTHYHRVIAYDDEGRERLRFGSYGEGPGQFIYPTCVEFGPHGRLYVAEYGGHDRVQVFDSQGGYLFEFGSFGSGPGQFDRPQSLLFDPDGSELYIADACNHRIVVVDPTGRPIRTFGSAGTGPGELHYPYGLAWLGDGTLLVAEFGNNRIQRFEGQGRPRGRYGRLGTREGDLRYPWGVCASGDEVFVLDSGNDRVQAFRAP